MLKLKNVSKFYYNKGVVASGFSKINLELNIGEFVVITGESGSGKSTLLNVISGLDTYEEGEMYINGEETSYYSENDFEEYRKKYIGNIFQNFNLINSYTVKQNLELMYTLNNIKDKTTNEKIDDLLEQVGLKKYKNTKVSKLSGGQKQRVAIARALAKDTPIIVADEPTGNLDSKSAKEIMKLLYEISKNKLVIIVTHNYEQVEEYATRKIRMHDGKILEDITIEKVKETKYVDKDYGYPKFIEKVKLGILNAFNVVPKLLLLLLVYLLLSISVIGEYTSNLKSNNDVTNFGFNNYFSDTRDTRIIIQKKDKSVINEDDYKYLNSVKEVNSILKNDVILDLETNLSDDKDFYLYGNIASIKDFDGNVDVGRLPENDNEIISLSYKYDYMDEIDKIEEKELYLTENMYGKKITDTALKIVGIKFMDYSISTSPKFYVSDKIIDEIGSSINSSISTYKITINDKLIGNSDYYSEYIIYPNKNVEKGKVLVPVELSYVCKNYNCINNKLNIKVENIYYNDEIDLIINSTYKKDNFERLTGLQGYDKYSNAIFINDEEYNNLYDKDPYQSSVFVSDSKYVSGVIKELENNGYNTLYIKDTLVDFSEEIRVFVNLFKIIGIVIALVALFFISYFVIKLILKSRNTYYSTIRILGASKKDVKTIISVELNTILNITYLTIILASILVTNDIIKWNYLKDLVTYLNIFDYVVLYIILFIMSYLIATRYSHSLFKKSAMNTYREV